jgi:hypothetical protein
MLWAIEAQKQIASIVHSPLLAHYDKKSLRGLTKSEMGQLEHIKLCILCNLDPYMDIDADMINQLLKNQSEADTGILKLIRHLSKEFLSSHDRQPSIEEKRNIQASAYASSRKS